MFGLDVLHYTFVPALILLHLSIAPYTKVEESFNIQAIHDILEYGIPTSNVYYKFKALYDHMTFSGSVPRTFVGSLVVAAFARPFLWFADIISHHGISQCLLRQDIVRCVLGLLTGLSFVVFTSAVNKAYGKNTAFWYSLLQASQFHVIFYASRTLPNTFAFCLSTLALAALLPGPFRSIKQIRLSFYLLTLATVIFRSELALLLASQASYLLFRTHGFDNRFIIIRKAILPSVITASIVGLCLTVGIDTYFWQSSTLLWPEAAAFLFNVLPSEDHMGASAWGTSPWHWYFTSALPRLILSPALYLIPYGIFFTTQQTAILDNCVPAISYIILYSILPHKEIRFIFPVVPSITLAAAISVSYLSTRRQLIARYMTYIVLLSTMMVTFISHFILLPLSAQSYPGGQALQDLHHHHENIIKYNESEFIDQKQIKVHLTNLALQSGITRFLEQPYTYHELITNLQPSKQEEKPPHPLILPGSPDGRKPALTLHPKPSQIAASKQYLHNRNEPMWIYDKSSSESDFLTSTFWSQFDYVIVENPALVIGAWKIISEIKALQKGKPKLLKPNEKRSMIYFINHHHHHSSGDANEDRIYNLLQAMYWKPVPWIYSIIHDILREGYGTIGGGRSLTGGYWIDWGLETRLYILAQDDSWHP